MSSRLPPRKRYRWNLLMAGVATLPVLVVVGASLIVLLLQSLGLMPFAGRPELTVEAWTRGADELVRSTGVSFYIAAASTLISVLIGFMIAAYILTMPGTGRLLGILSAGTIPIPHLIGAGAVGLLLSDSGFLARLLGMPPAFPPFVGGSWWAAAIFEYAWKESAFVALMVVGSIAPTVGGLCDAAAVLGATARQRILSVVLPLAWPSLAVSALIIFVYTLGSYEAVWLLGPTAPEPLPVRAVRLFGSIDLAARPQAMVTALVATGVGTVVIVAGVLGLRRLRGLR